MNSFMNWLDKTPANLFMFFTVVVALFTIIITIIIHIFSTRYGKISKLTEEIEKLKSQNLELNSKLTELNNLNDIDKQMHLESDGDYLLWKEKSIKVCPACWYHDKKITPIQTNSMDGTYECSRCHHSGILNKSQHQNMFNIMALMMSKENQKQ